MKGRRRYCALLAFGILLPASAPPPLDWAGLEQVGEEELKAQRGGFTWQGVTIRFGAEVRTYLEDELVLRTVVHWTEEGQTASETVSGVLTPVDAASLQNGILSTGNITINVGDAKVYLANEGQTAIIHQTDGSIRNVLINTANGVSARQEIDATLDLGGYEGFRAEIGAARMAEQVGDMISHSSAGLFGQ
ncbi:MAG: hypothetical protein ACK40O_10680 [Allosphingosinicella sp.]